VTGELVGRRDDRVVLVVSVPGRNPMADSIRYSYWVDDDDDDDDDIDDDC
jgi:hypothetical protein